MMKAKLNKTNLHIYLNQAFEEDYQLPMLGQNQIKGILPVTGCEINGKSRYTYDVRGMASVYSIHENQAIQLDEIEGIVCALLESIEDLEKYMLNADCLILDPEYIFQKEEEWYFCYIPGWKGNLNRAFHQLTEYFVKTLNYEDTKGIFLAYELHKATLQEKYDLKQIIQEYKAHEEQRNQTMEEWKEEKYGDVFLLAEEDSLPNEPDIIREEGGTWKSWRKAARRLKRNRWGSWNDLIVEGGEAE